MARLIAIGSCLISSFSVRYSPISFFFLLAPAVSLLLYPGLEGGQETVHPILHSVFVLFQRFLASAQWSLRAMADAAKLRLESRHSSCTALSAPSMGEHAAELIGGLESVEPHESYMQEACRWVIECNRGSDLSQPELSFFLFLFLGVLSFFLCRLHRCQLCVAMIAPDLSVLFLVLVAASGAPSGNTWRKRLAQNTKRRLGSHFVSEYYLYGHHLTYSEFNHFLTEFEYLVVFADQHQLLLMRLRSGSRK